MNYLALALAIVSVSAIAREPPSSPQGSTPGGLQVGNGPPQLPADPRIFISHNEILARIAQADANVSAGKGYSGEPLVMQGRYRATMEWRNAAQKNVNVHETDSELFVVL